MSTPYSKFIDSFLRKIDDYKMINYSDWDIKQDSIKYMKTAITQFCSECEISNYDFDDVIEQFSIDMSHEEVDIIAKGMVVEWLKPSVYKARAMENIMNTKDFSYFSPQKMLEQNRALLADAKKDFTNSLVYYTYKIGNIEEFNR